MTLRIKYRLIYKIIRLGVISFPDWYMYVGVLMQDQHSHCNRRLNYGQFRKKNPKYTTIYKCLFVLLLSSIDKNLTYTKITLLFCFWCSLFVDDICDNTKMGRWPEEWASK